MANPSIVSNYAGDYVEELMMLAVTQNEIVDGGHIHIEDNIQNKRSLVRVRQTDMIQDMAATPVSYGGVSTDERLLDPDPFLIYIEFDPNNFRSLWEKWHPKGEFVFTELAPEVQRELLAMLIEGEAGVNNYMGKAIIQGNKAGAAPYNKFDGLVTKALADADVIDVAGAAALTNVNIDAKLQEIYNASREAVKNNPAYKIFMSTIDHEKYRQYLVGLTSKSIDPTAAAPKLWHGKEIVPLVDMPENTVIATVADGSRKSNIWMGVRGLIDNTTIKVAQVQANSDLWFFKMKMTCDTQIKFGQDLVLYKP